MKKPILLLLAISLTANTVLLISRLEIPERRLVAKSPAAAAGDAGRTGLSGETVGALSSGDEAALIGLGLSEEQARGLVLGRQISRFFAQMREFQGVAKEDPKKYWRNPSSGRRFAGLTPEQRAVMRKLERELEETVRATFEDAGGGYFVSNDRFRFLSKEKREEIRRIERDYDEMVTDVRCDQESVALRSDRAKLVLLEKEKERDILAALTPQEREMDQLCNSRTAASVRFRYGDLIETEEMYRKIYALQKDFDDRYAVKGDVGERFDEESPEKAAAQQNLNNAIRGMLGEDAITKFRRENDSDLKVLTALQTRLNLPAGTSDQVIALRDVYASRSQTIHADNTLPSVQRREQLTELAKRARAEAAAKLGQEGGEAYAQRSVWIGMLNRGQAFSTNPADSAGDENLRSSVFPLTKTVR